MPRVPSSTFAGGNDFRVRMRQLRLIRRWDQPTLGQRCGLSAGTISAIETGKSQASLDQVDAISSALGYSVEFMMAPVLSPTTRPWLRSYADASKREADARRAVATLAAEYIRRLRLRPLQDLIPDFSGDLDDPMAIEEAAQHARELAGLEEDAVVGNTIRAAERMGCVVLPFESELGRHLGMSVRADDLPIICVAKTGIPGDRQRFTVAHELGHLVLHATSRPPDDAAKATTMERQAHRFAAAFLAPADPLLETLDQVSKGRVTLAVLAEVKAVWGMAIRALVGRFKELGRIDADHAQSLYKQISSRGWNKAEPVEVGLEVARWLPSRITAAAETEDLTKAAVICADSIGASADDLYAMVNWSSRSADVIRLDRTPLRLT